MDTNRTNRAVLAAVDPTGCDCRDCQTGHSVPANLMVTDDAARLATGQLANRTGATVRLSMTYENVQDVGSMRVADVVTAHVTVGDMVIDVSELARSGDL